MGDTKATRSISWWESQLPALAGELHEALRRRIPSLRQHHDDLVNETLAALAERVTRDPSAFPASWQAAGEPAMAEDRTYLPRLAMTILRRRVADLFRDRALRWARTGDEQDGVNEPPSEDPSAERRALMARMLKVCVGVLAELSDEDRDLVSAAAGLGEGPERALSDRERQRLRRVRLRLMDELKRKLGAGAAELLREEC